VSRSRRVLLLSVLLSLAVCSLIVSVSQTPSTKKATPWLTEEKFYQFIGGQSLALPGGESLTLYQDQIESLRIEAGGQGPESSEAADVSFVVRTDQGRYGVQGIGLFCNRLKSLGFKGLRLIAEQAASL
jgi:hypothetical protein